MFENVVALDSKVHADHRLKRSNSFAFAKNVLGAPLAMSEITKASREYPIFFPTSGRFLPVAQMGYRKDGNCSVPDDHIDPRRLALFMARSLLREIRDGGTDACSTA